MDKRIVYTMDFVKGRSRAWRAIMSIPCEWQEGRPQPGKMELYGRTQGMGIETGASTSIISETPIKNIIKNILGKKYQ